VEQGITPHEKSLRFSFLVYLEVTPTEHKVPWGILENRIATPAGISFLELPCIIFHVILGRFPLDVPTKNIVYLYGH
jgi:hypothetical protein